MSIAYEALKMGLITRGTAFLLIGLVVAIAVTFGVMGYLAGYNAGETNMQNQMVERGFGTWKMTPIKEKKEFQWIEK